MLIVYISWAAVRVDWSVVAVCIVIICRVRPLGIVSCSSVDSTRHSRRRESLSVKGLLWFQVTWPVKNRFLVWVVPLLWFQDRLSRFIRRIIWSPYICYKQNGGLFTLLRRLAHRWRLCFKGLSTLPYGGCCVRRVRFLCVFESQIKERSFP